MEAVFGSTRPPRRHRLTPASVARRPRLGRRRGGRARRLLDPQPLDTPATSTPSLATTGRLGQSTAAAAATPPAGTPDLVPGQPRLRVRVRPGPWPPGRCRGHRGGRQRGRHRIRPAERRVELGGRDRPRPHAPPRRPRGSLADVAARATKAAVHAGAADIDQITSPRTSSPRPTAAEIFGMQVVDPRSHARPHLRARPGHQGARRRRRPSTTAPA